MVSYFRLVIHWYADRMVNVKAYFFKDVSATSGILNGCIGIIDGFLLQTCNPLIRGSNGNVRQGLLLGPLSVLHYQCSRYLWFKMPLYLLGISGTRWMQWHSCILTMWSTANDNSLPPLGHSIVGDNAYVCHLLTPFSGNKKFEAQKDSYNFYISQLCMQIEMAFRIMSNKFQILKQPVTVGVHSMGKFLFPFVRHNLWWINVIGLKREHWFVLEAWRVTHQILHLGQ